jgi:hypothetical protein
MNESIFKIFSGELFRTGSDITFFIPITFVNAFDGGD